MSGGWTRKCYHPDMTTETVDTFHLSPRGWIGGTALPPPPDRVETWERTKTWVREEDQPRGWLRERRAWVCVWSDGSAIAGRDRLRVRHPIPDAVGKRVRFGRPC